MLKSILISVILVTTVSSCSDNSFDESIFDDYVGSMLCGSLSEFYNSVKVVDVSGGQIEIQLGSELGSMFGSIDETNDIKIDAFKGTLKNGMAVNFLEGRGSFSRKTVFEVSDQVKFIDLFFTDIDGNESACNLQLTEL